MVDGGGGDVDPLGNLGVAVAVELEAEELAGGAVAGEAHPDSVAAWVVGLASSASDSTVRVVESGGDGFVVSETGPCGCVVEDLDDLGAQAAGEFA